MEILLSSLFIRILNMSITAGYCIAAVLLLRLLFRRAPRKYLYALWLVVAFRLLCPVSVSTEFSLFNLPQFDRSAPTEEAGAMEYIPEQIGGMEKPQIYTGWESVDALVNDQLPRAGGLQVHGISVKNLLYLRGQYQEPVVLLLETGKYIWALGVLAFLIYIALSMAKLGRKVERAVRVTEPERESRSRRKPGWEIYECDTLASPFTMGVYPPRIYLPCQLKGERRRMVLLHEQCHIRRGDHLVKLLAFFLLSVYWFHPLVWAAWFGMCRDMEMSCDEKVLEELGAERRKEYSMTLLAFAAGEHIGSRMPLAFGEQDVKRRIEPSLRFRKTGIWAAVLAVGVIAAALLLLGTNGAKKEAADNSGVQEGKSEAADGLYEARNPYVGDASANGKLAGAIAAALPDSAFGKYSFKQELQTSEEPYEYHYILNDTLEEEPYLWEMAAPATLMLALTDNLGEAQWKYHYRNGGRNREWTLADAALWCGVEDVKAYAQSPEKVQELLDILEQLKKEDTRLDGESIPDMPMEESKNAEDEFQSWYARLPYEWYENAVPLEEYNFAKKHEGMAVLAQTEDGIATVYGCISEKYGTRGVTIDYRITPDGDSNHNYFDWSWNPAFDDAKVFMEGQEMILSLSLLGNAGAYQSYQVVLGTYETGHLEMISKPWQDEMAEEEAGEESE